MTALDALILIGVASAIYAVVFLLIVLFPSLGRNRGSGFKGTGGF